MCKEKDRICNMISEFDQTIQTYEYNVERIQYLEDLENDLRHEISLGKKRGTVEGYKLYDLQRDTLIERYERRDQNDRLKPLYDILKQNKGLKKELTKAQSEVNKIVKQHERRAYKPRVLNKGEMTAKTWDNLQQNKPMNTMLNDLKQNLGKKLR